MPQERLLWVLINIKTPKKADNNLRTGTAMPKIPMIQSQRSLPNSSGREFENNRPAEIIGGAVQQFGNTLADIQQAAEERDAKTKIFELKQVLRQKSREFYDNDLPERTGELALPDKETGRKGVFEDYDEMARTHIADGVKGIPPRFSSLARQELESAANPWRDRVATYQAAQKSAYRKSVLNGNVIEIEEDLKLSSMSGFASVDDVEFAYKEIENLVTAEGTPDKAYLQTKKANLYKSTILAAAEQDPANALKILKSDKAKRALDPAQIETLDNYVEKKRVEKAVDNTLTTIQSAELDSAGQKTMAREILKDDRDALKLVLGELTYQDGVSESIRISREAGVTMDVFQEMSEGNIPERTDVIHGRGRFAELDEPSRRFLVKEIDSSSGGGVTKTEARQARDYFLEGQAMGEIYSGKDKKWVDSQVVTFMKTEGKEGIPPQVGRKVKEQYDLLQRSPQIGTAFSNLKNTYDFDKEDSALFYRTLVNEVNVARKGDKDELSFEKVLAIGDKLAAKIFEEKAFGIFPVVEARYKNKRFKGLQSEENEVMAPVWEKKFNWKNSAFDERDGLWRGTGQDGKFYAYNPSTKKYYEVIPPKQEKP